MAPVILLGLIAALPVVLILLLRSNAAITFFSLCAGSVLVHYFGNNAVTLVSGSVNQNNMPVIVQISLLFLPAVLSLLMLRKTVSPSMLILNAATAVGTGLATVILLVPLLPTTMQANIIASSLWTQFADYQGKILAIVTVLALIDLWLTIGHKSGGKHKKHH